MEVGERRAQLLALGLEMFSRLPYEEVSMDALARAAGVSKGLLYHYFPTKRALYIAALGLAAGQLLADTTTRSDTPPEQRVRRGLETYLGFVDRHGPAYVALMQGGLGADPQVAAILEETRSTFVGRIEEGLPPASTGALVHVALRGWIGFVEATALDWAAHRTVTSEALVELLSGVLFDVLARAGCAERSG